MRPSFRPILLSAALVLAAAWAPAVAEETAPVGTAGPSQEYQDQLKELAQFTENRNLDTFEMTFRPLELDDIVVKDRLGHYQVYTYLTFQIRNQGIQTGNVADGSMPRYAEVLKAINDQYSQIATVSTDGGGTVTVGSADNPENVILERRDLAVKARSVDLTLVARDDLGRSLNPIEGSFATVNRGIERIDGNIDRIRERIEERADRRLRSVHDIRGLTLPPFDGSQRDAEGQLVGEVTGVAIFPRLDLHAHEFTIEVHGLSNKLRVQVPAAETGKPENYLAMKVLRRTMTLSYHRPGDEFHRNAVPYTLTEAGYRWIETFQRIDKRRTMAMTRFYIDGLYDADHKLRPEVEAQFWTWYEQTRAAYPDAADKLPDLAATLKEPAGQ